MIRAIDSFKKVELLAQKKEVSFYKISKDLNFSNSFFSEWKKGKMMPKIEKLEKLAGYFNVPIEYFLNE